MHSSLAECGGDMAWYNGLAECGRLGATCVLDWSTIVGGVVGVATVAVAVLAWLTSRRAAEIADEATRIAKQQKEEEAQRQAAQRRTLEQTLYNEVVGLQQVSGAALTSALLGIDLSHATGLGNEHMLRRTLDLCSDNWVPVTVSVQNQLYLLNRGHGEVLARLVGEAIRLRSMAKALRSKLVITRQEDDGYIVVFQGRREDLMVFSRTLERFVADAQFLAADFLLTVQQSKIDPAVFERTCDTA